MKKIAYFIASIAVLFASCSPMDDNYSEYVNRKTTYSPKITVDDRAYMSVPEAGSLTLFWNLPESDRIASVEIVHVESSEKSETIKLGLVEEYTFSGLEVQSHDFKLYTVDKFGNRSIPTVVSLVPLQDRNGTAEKPYPVTVAEEGYMGVPEDGSINLYWTLPTFNSNTTDVVVVCMAGETTVATINAGVTDTCTFTGLDTETEYDFYITVENSYGNFSKEVVLSSLKAVKGANGAAEREEPVEEEPEEGSEEETTEE